MRVSGERCQRIIQLQSFSFNRCTLVVKMLTEQLCYIIPIVCILLTVVLLLLVLFRREVKIALRESFYSIVMHACVLIQLVKDFATRKKNTVGAVVRSGEVAVVTGARGIGFEVIKKLLESDMTVIIGCRDVDVGGRALKVIRASGVTTGVAQCYTLDLASLTSVKTFADNVLGNRPEVHLLVNNAGVSESTRSVTDEGIERSFAVNYLGHCYLSHLLLPRLAASACTTGIPARIVNVASVAYRFPFIGRIHYQDLALSKNYQEYVAYGQSKLAQMIFTKTLDAKLTASGVPVRVFAIHPGIVHTNIVKNTFAHRVFHCFFPAVLRTPEQGARSVYYACVSPELESRGGVYIYSCAETSACKSIESEEAQNKLWITMMDLLAIQKFGGILTRTTFT